MRVLLYVQGEFFQDTWINVSLPYLVWPVRNVERGVRCDYLTRFEPRPGPEGEIWDCDDPAVALREGALIYVGEGA